MSSTNSHALTYSEENNTLAGEKSYRPTPGFLLHCGSKRPIQILSATRARDEYNHALASKLNNIRVFPQVSQETAN